MSTPRSCLHKQSQKEELPGRIQLWWQCQKTWLCCATVGVWDIGGEVRDRRQMHKIEVGYYFCWWVMFPCYRWQKLLVGKNCSRISSPPNHNPQRKKNSRFCAAMLFQTLCRCWTNCHHPLENNNETHGRPRSTPPQHSQRSDLRDLHHFPWNEHTPTSQQIYRFFYHHCCIFFNWSWGWPWNRCRVVRWTRRFKLFLCDEKKKCCSI